MVSDPDRFLQLRDFLHLAAGSPLIDQGNPNAGAYPGKSATYQVTDFDENIKLAKIPVREHLRPLHRQPPVKRVQSDVNGDGKVNALDIQFVINGALGITTGVDTDVDSDGKTNALDIQITINAALGIG